MNPEHILVVDDEPDIRRLVKEILEDEDYRVSTADTADTARQAHKHHPDLVLLDIWLPDTDGIALLKEWSANGRLEVPVVMMSGHGTIETAVEATRLGAYDFIEKPLSMGKLLVTVKRALQTEQLRQENLRLRTRAEPRSELVGSSTMMQKLQENIARIAATDTWVLITGEPGSGKAVAAQALHRHSARGECPFIEISLAAIPVENIAIQLFGSEEAGEITLGSFEQASGGTLLLDEVGDLDLAIQTQLLNTLEEKQFMRVGGKQPVDMDVRIFAATNQNLATAVAQGRFREDLYYRLNVVPLHIPPLREHPQDVPELARYYVEWMVNNEHLSRRKFSTEAIEVLRNYAWPGNVRELRNLVQRLLILQREQEIGVQEVKQSLGTLSVGEAGTFPEPLFAQPLREARDGFEKAYLEHHLQRTKGNVTALAEITGMERTHLYRKLKHLGINPKDAKGK